MPPRTKHEIGPARIEHLYPALRLKGWRLVIETLRAVHAARFPKGRRFSSDAELLLVYGAVVMSALEGQDMRASKISQFLDLPHETARRQLDKLVSLGLVKRVGRHYQPTELEPKSHIWHGRQKRMVLEIAELLDI